MFRAGIVAAGFVLVVQVGAAPSWASDAKAVGAKTAATEGLPLAEGEIRKVDLAQKKITVKHGRIENLNMNAMTMIFPVADPTWLQKFKAGDKVKLAIDRVNGTMTIVRLEPAAP